MLETHKCCHPANISPPRVASLKKRCTFSSAREVISVWSKFALKIQIVQLYQESSNIKQNKF